jgi:alpha-L-fucosidase
MLGPDSWLTGGEGGAADYPLWYAVNTTDGTDDARPILPLGPHDEGGFPDGAQFKSWEADCSFFDGCHPWFCCGTVPTHDEAVLLWDSTWGRGATLILNLPPSKDGLIEPALVAAAAQLAADRVQRYESPVASTTGLGDAPIVLDLPYGMSVSHVLLAEETLSTLGQLVSSYTLEVLVGTTWEHLDLGPAVCPPQTQQQCGGSTIGVRKVDRLTMPAGDLQKLRLTVTGNVCAKCPPPSISFKAFFF